ncbi:GNAT family N-acetyltransferase [Mycolicibacterium goodii]|uniref:GNAT family N-acetyltransferase n=1 Tax=Mycolicibacterium goodii TaxID=134601 RepID=UPI001BDCFB1F|nr:GNAT family N-acetyltransferase [Mycolicibacterium goodii]MBU8812011.1 GNAT family N-acetyltransferase [Mycolicibacterium goodii]ULN47029.1 GNAT family N-acetyltransferase [Mycolicibacterium goodii]
MTATSDLTSSRLVGFDALGNEEIEAWHALRASNPALDSPYFHPGFAAAVHATGRHVSVVVVRNSSGAVSALLPGHREGAVLQPVSWPGADFQGPLFRPAEAPSASEFLVDGLRVLMFDHLISQGPDFDPWIVSSQPSPWMDVTGGLDGYLGRASRSGRDKMKEARRCLAKAERSHGPVRFAVDVVDDDALARLIELKRAQYAATGSRDFFAKPGHIELMHRLLHTREPGFGGVLSTVRVGDRLVAAHFGIRSDHVLHWWFPVYDPVFSQLSPGWILLREVISAAPGSGILRLDLGRGDDDYKRRAKTGETVVSQAFISNSATRRVLRGGRDAVMNAVKNSPLAPRLRQGVRYLRGVRSSGRQMPSRS